MDELHCHSCSGEIVGAYKEWNGLPYHTGCLPDVMSARISELEERANNAEDDAALFSGAQNRIAKLEKALRSVVEAADAFIVHVGGNEDHLDVEPENRSDYRQLAYECDKARQMTAEGHSTTGDDD